MARGKTLVNRTIGTADERVLTYKFDGHEHELEPGENHGIPDGEVDQAILQNKVMGTEEFYDPMNFQSYVGVVGNEKRWPCTPIGTVKDAPQVINRKAHEARTGKTSKVMPADGPTPFDARMPGALDVSFRG